MSNKQYPIFVTTVFLVVDHEPSKKHLLIELMVLVILVVLLSHDCKSGQAYNVKRRRRYINTVPLRAGPWWPNPPDLMFLSPCSIIW
jgi:hypothetical protein